MTDKRQSKQEFDLLVDVNKDFTKRTDRINRAKRAIINKKPLTLDSNERMQAFIRREMSKTQSKRVIPNPPVVISDDEPGDEPDEEMETAIIGDDDDHGEPLPQAVIMDDMDFADTLERLIGNVNDILSIETLEQGLEAAKPVGLLEIGPFIRGTAFLVGQDLILTSKHNFLDEQDVRKSLFVLGFEDNDFGARQERQEFKLDMDRFYFDDTNLDIALIAVKPKSFDGADLSDYRRHRLFEEEGKIIIGHAVNVIHHAGGERKRISMHNSNLVDIQNGTDGDQFCYYSSDTLKGSSGAPVFNKDWEVIGLHRKGVPKLSDDGKVLLIDGSTIEPEDISRHDHDVKWISNQGVRVSRIITALKAAQMDAPAQQAILNDLLESWGVEPLLIV